jgi:hypothetical protein
MKRWAKILGIGVILYMIIGVGGIAVYDNIRISPREREVKTNFAPVIAALEAYRKARGKYPEELTALVPDYIKELPSCPILPPGRIDILPTRLYSTHLDYFTLSCNIGVLVYPQEAVYFSEKKNWGRLD